MAGTGRTPWRGAQSPGALNSSALTRRGCVQYSVAAMAEEMAGNTLLLLSLLAWVLNESLNRPLSPPPQRPDRKESRSIVCPCSLSLLLLLASLGDEGMGSADSDFLLFVRPLPVPVPPPPPPPASFLLSSFCSPSSVGRAGLCFLTGLRRSRMRLSRLSVTLSLV